MKSTNAFLLSVFTIASLALTSCGGNETKSEAKKDSTSAMAPDSMLAAGEKIIYVCPMPEDAEIKSDKPGKCPKCGMDLEKKIVKDTVK